MALVLTLAAGAALALAIQTPDASAPDPLVDAVIPPGEPTLQDYRARLAQETRDPAWADRAEAALRARIAAIHNVDGIRMRCARTVCEVAGRIASDDHQAINAAMQALQSVDAPREIAALGLRNGAQAFGGAGKESRFVGYWTK